MAETAVNFAIQTVCTLLVDEIKLLGSARQEVESIKSELESIRSFLKDADARAAAEEEGESNDGVLTWVKQVRKEAYNIEDVIDKFSLDAAQLPRGTGLLCVFRKISRCLKKLKLRHEIAHEIQDIKSSLSDIQRRGQSYNFTTIDPGSSSGSRNVLQHDSRVGSLFIEDSEVVGVESTREQLIGLLVNGTNKRSVIAVVGEGGLGKTTLAGKIYNYETVKKHFDCQASITVGKGYTKEGLLRSIIHEFYRPTGSVSAGIDKMEEKDLTHKMTEKDSIDKMEEKDLITALREHLKDKSYMVLFDDVWKIEFWGDVEHALPDNNKNSRIMLTTRNKGVADFVPLSIVHVHILQPLPSDKAWQLFCRRAFDSELGCPPELKKLSHDILAKCGGLPLAIVAVGGLLSTKRKVVSEWRKLLDGLGSKLGSDPHLKSCNRVLSESYYDLPQNLKSCLLYFGLLPESFSIFTNKLICLWIAEGFVPYSKRPPTEQVAEEYLTELIDRSLVQVTQREFSGQAGTCKVHDLMREIILRKTKELGFSRVLNGEDVSDGSETRRISIQRGTDNVLESIKDSKIRSVLLFNVVQLPQSLITTLIANFKLIKVLDFEDTPIDYLPDGVGKLFHLHYLNLMGTRVKKLPKSIGMLFNLETLYLRYSLVSELPIEIKNLKKLRRLVAGLPSGANTLFKSGVKIHEGFGALTDLQSLHFLNANSKAVKELGKLRQLRKLGVILRNRNVKDLFAMVHNMESLEFLWVESTSGDEILDTQSMASPPQSLQHFALKANIKRLPDWIFELQNLLSVSLVSTCRSTDISMSVFEALSNLLMLSLEGTCSDEQLHFEEGWFPKIQELQLFDFRQLKTMMIDKGSMPNLRKLAIGPCPLLKEIPTGIEHLRNLKTVGFRKMVKEAYHMIKSENWENVTNHIPTIIVTVSETDRGHFFYPAKYLRSLSPEDFQRLIQRQSQSKEQTHD